MHENISSYESNTLSHHEKIIFSIIIVLLITISAIANLIVLWVFYRERSLRHNIASVFLINLIIIDISNTLLVMPISLASITSSTWHMSNASVRLSAFISTTLELVSMLALAIISLDRLAAVMRPLVYRARMTVNKAVQFNIYIWCQAIIFSLIPLPTTWYIFNYRYKSCTLVSYSSHAGFYVYMVLQISCNFIFSLIVILATYFYIFRVARGHSKRISNAVVPRNLFNVNNNKINTESFRQREIRTACKILFVIGAFVICHVPYASMRIIELASYNSHNIALTVATKWASYSKSTLDPFIYCLLQKRFRKAFVKSLSRKRTRVNSKRLSSAAGRRITPISTYSAIAYFEKPTPHRHIQTRTTPELSSDHAQRNKIDSLHNKDGENLNNNEEGENSYPNPSNISTALSSPTITLTMVHEKPNEHDDLEARKINDLL